MALPLWVLVQPLVGSSSRLTPALSLLVETPAPLANALGAFSFACLPDVITSVHVLSEPSAFAY